MTPTATAKEKLNKVPTNTYSDFALSPSEKRNSDFAAIRKPMASYCPNRTKVKVSSRSIPPMSLPALSRSFLLAS